MNLNTFFRELKRRNIYKVAVVYAVTGWIVVQAASIAADAFGAPPWVLKMIVFAVILGFPLAMVFTWAFEITAKGVSRTPADVSRKEINDLFLVKYKYTFRRL